MLSYEDCVGMCALTPDEVIAVAQHEHVPVIVAAELGENLCDSPGGLLQLARILREDLEDAVFRRDFMSALKLRALVFEFFDHHPTARQYGDEMTSVLGVPCN